MPEAGQVCEFLQQQACLCSPCSSTIFLTEAQILPFYLQENALLGDYLYHFLQCNTELIVGGEGGGRWTASGSVAVYFNRKGSGSYGIWAKFSHLPSLMLPPCICMQGVYSLTMEIFCNKRHNSRKQVFAFLLPNFPPLKKGSDAFRKSLVKTLLLNYYQLNGDVAPFPRLWAWSCSDLQA